eukprot:2329872-Pleurochrysis_carterae.AAC.1
MYLGEKVGFADGVPNRQRDTPLPHLSQKKQAANRARTACAHGARTAHATRTLHSAAIERGAGARTGSSMRLRSSDRQFPSRFAAPSALF